MAFEPHSQMEETSGHCSTADEALVLIGKERDLGLGAPADNSGPVMTYPGFRTIYFSPTGINYF